jgi:hypothetical protein
MHQMWRTEPNGDLTTVVANARLVIKEGERFSWWLLLGRSFEGSGSQEVPLESGCEDNVHAAKAKAAEKARRPSAMLAPVKTAGRHILETICKRATLAATVWRRIDRPGSKAARFASSIPTGFHMHSTLSKRHGLGCFASIPCVIGGNGDMSLPLTESDVCSRSPCRRCGDDRSLVSLPLLPSLNFRPHSDQDRDWQMES